VVIVHNQVVFFLELDFAPRKSQFVPNIAKMQMVARHFQELTRANNIAGNGQDPLREERENQKGATISTDFPIPKTIGEAVGTSRNKKTLRIKIASEADSYDPHVLTRGSPKKVFPRRPKVPAAGQSDQDVCQLCQVKRSASPGARRAGAK